MVIIGKMVQLPSLGLRIYSHYVQYVTRRFVSTEPQIITYVKDKVGYIVWNRPEVLNATSVYTFRDTTKCLMDFESDPSVAAIVLTGNGKYFSSGNDMQVNSAFFVDKDTPEETEKGVKYFVLDMLDPFTTQLIDSKKPLIIAANGPGVGIGCLILGLSDMVIASISAYFWAPLGTLGINPELCSSYMFPRTLGRSLATQMLLFGKKLSAQDAKSAGLVSVVIPPDNFKSQVEEMVGKWVSDTQDTTLKTFRQLMWPATLRNKLHSVRRAENELFIKHFQHPDVIAKHKQFMLKSKK